MEKSIGNFFSSVTLLSSMRTHPRPLISVTENHEKHKDPPTPKAWRNYWTPRNLTRNCTSFVRCFIIYKFQPNIVKYSNVGLLIKWWQLYKTIALVNIWDKNDFSWLFQEQQPKYGVFQEQFQNQRKIKNNSRNSRTNDYPEKVQSDCAPVNYREYVVGNSRDHSQEQS